MLSDESLHQLGKLHQICDAQDRTTLAEGALWSGRHNIGPLRRHRAYGLVVDAQHEPRAVPVVPLGDADKLPSAERVKWVRHAHKTRRSDGRACILSVPIRRTAGSSRVDGRGQAVVAGQCRAARHGAGRRSGSVRMRTRRESRGSTSAR
jgi:hypothetical protein